MPDRQHTTKVLCLLLPVMTLVLLAALVLTLAGCGTTNTVNSVSSSSPNEERVKLPANFPDDFPQPIGAQLVSATQEMDQYGQPLFIVGWRTKTGQAEVIADFQTRLKAKGWEITAVVDGPPPGLRFKRPGDKSAGALKVSTEGAETTISAKVYHR